MFRTKKLLFSFSTLLLTLTLMLPACNLPIITVDCNVADLIASINHANANTAPSTLELAPNCIYTLTSIDNTYISTFGGSTVNNGGNGLPQINTPVTINGNNSTIIRADGAPIFRFFYITYTGSLTVNNLTLENGFADGGDSWSRGSGGAIYDRGNYLEINNSIFLSNEASHTGGALHLVGGRNTYINGSTIHSNTALFGGGIRVNYGNLLSIDSSEIYANWVSDRGGGINIYGSGAELIINDSLLAFNHADESGGGIYIDDLKDHPTTITGTTIQGNSANLSGSGVFIRSRPLSIRSSHFIENHTDGYGGGLFYQNWSTETYEAAITNTTFDGNSALSGGGIHFSGDLMRISSSIFQNNQAENGAGIHNGLADGGHQFLNRTTSTLFITNSTLQENKASGVGGGAFNEGTMTSGESNYRANQSTTLGGGIHNTGEFTSHGDNFDANIAGLDGGGINNANIAKIKDATFRNNTSERGGGLSSIGGNAEISDSNFANNSASDRGGAIFNFGDLPESSSMKILGSEIINNTAPFGGGIATSGGMIIVKNSIVAHSPSGGDCFGTGAVFSGVGENIDTDGSCVGFTLRDDPLLDPLTNNSGPTYTHALRFGSPAIDVAPDCTTSGGVVISIDQRGLPRPGGVDCDLGAYEDPIGNPVLPTQTPVSLPCIPSAPEVTAIKNANCRYGPSTAYDIADTLFEGQAALIRGRNEMNTWWQIQGATFGTDCWVSYVTVEVCGETDAVPIGVWPALPDAPPSEPPSEPPVASPQGCFVYDDNKNLICTIPCPASSESYGLCTP